MDQQKKLHRASIVLHYFPELSPTQVALFNRLGTMYAYWNAAINLISRKDIDHLYLRHVLHSLAIAKVNAFSAHTKILDFGTWYSFSDYLSRSKISFSGCYYKIDKSRARNCNNPWLEQYSRLLGKGRDLEESL